MNNISGPSWRKNWCKTYIQKSLQFEYRFRKTYFGEYGFGEKLWWVIRVQNLPRFSRFGYFGFTLFQKKNMAYDYTQKSLLCPRQIWMKNHLSEPFWKNGCMGLKSKETHFLGKSWHRAYVHETAFWNELGCNKYHVWGPL